MVGKRDLYEDVMKKVDWYDKREVKNKLRPYDNYLKSVRKYYFTHPSTFVYEEYVDPLNQINNKKISVPNQKSSQQPKQNEHDKKTSEKNPGFWIKIPKLDDNDISQNKIEESYEKYVYENLNSKAKRDRGINIEYDPEKKRLKLERKPKTKTLYIYQKTSSIEKERKAINALMHKPLEIRLNLLKLFHNRYIVPLDNVENTKVDKWFVLTNDTAGTQDQKEFVEKALGTPDFAFLEGPPGSGKTTVLSELVHQLVSRGKKVLFCASTHVAVDNLLEKITDKNTKKPTDSNIIPIRIGGSDKISNIIAEYKYDAIVKKMSNGIKNQINNIQSPTEPQKILRDVLEDDDDTIPRIIRDCANLVCSTTIGILHHPDIRYGNSMPLFDYMILDESSKTTFQEFLVPALYAQKWIIVGDTKQLAPHTDQKEIAYNVNMCMDSQESKICCYPFLVKKQSLTIIVATDDFIVKEDYQKQCNKINIKLNDIDVTKIIQKCAVNVGSANSIAKIKPENISKIDPKDALIDGRKEIEIAIKSEHQTNEQKSLLNKKQNLWKTIDQQSHDQLTWKDQMAWRMAELTQTFNVTTQSGMQNSITKIKNDINDLMPYDSDERDKVMKELKSIKKIVLPSILQLLQHGYGEDSEGTIMTNGISKKNFEDRHVLLKWQYRMHPEIAKFPHEYVYESEALKTPNTMQGILDWKYNRYKKRRVWIDIIDVIGNRKKSPQEASKIIAELKKFVSVQML